MENQIRLHTQPSAHVDAVALSTKRKRATPNCTVEDAAAVMHGGCRCDTEFRSYVGKIRADTGWSSQSRIVGYAGECYCLDHLYCPCCGEKDWFECRVNEKSKDITCKSCNQNFQIKCKQISSKGHKRIKATNTLRTIGAEYRATIESLNDKIDYIFLLYDKSYQLLDILYEKNQLISEQSVIPRKPLSANARRAGWQGCNLLLTGFTSLLDSTNIVILES